MSVSTKRERGAEELEMWHEGEPCICSFDFMEKKMCKVFLRGLDTVQTC